MNAQELKAIQIFLDRGGQVQRLPTMSPRPRQVVHVRAQTRRLGASWISQQIRDSQPVGE